MQTDERIGTILDGKYELLELIGTGGMGKVYRAINLAMWRPVAVKLLRPSLLTDSKVIKRFQQEAQSISRLSHENIVEIYSVGAENDFYIAMELVHGQPLSKFLTSGPLSVEVFRDIARQCCSAIQHAHESGVIHRDLKPSNILIEKLDGKTRVKILDFGIAKLAPGAGSPVQHLTQTGEIFGSPSYMSPEQCRGEAIDARSDIYALGCVLYECLTGKQPFEGESVFEVMMKQTGAEPPSFSSVSPPLRKETAPLEPVVRKALQKLPEMRYQSMADLAHAIEYGDNSADQTILKGKKNLQLIIGSLAAFLSLASLFFIGQEMNFQAELAKYRSIRNAPKEEQFSRYYELAKSNLQKDPKLASQAFVAAAASLKPADTEGRSPSRNEFLPRVTDLFYEGATALQNANHPEEALAVYRALIDVFHSNTRNFHDDEVCVTDYPPLSERQVKHLLAATLLVANADFALNKTEVMTLTNTMSGLLRRYNWSADKKTALEANSLVMPEIDALIELMKTFAPRDAHKDQQQDMLVQQILARLYFGKSRLYALLGQSSKANEMLLLCLDARYKYEYKGFVIERCETLSKVFRQRALPEEKILQLAFEHEAAVRAKCKGMDIGKRAERDQFCELLMNHATVSMSRGRYKEAQQLLLEGAQVATDSEAVGLQNECKKRLGELSLQGSR